MFLIKKIKLINLGKDVHVEDGIRVSKIENELVAGDIYWGGSRVFAPDSKLVKTKNENEFLLPYVTAYPLASDIGDGFKEITFILNEYKDFVPPIMGYLIFIERSNGEIKTDGEVLFRRFFTEIVAILKEGNYIEFEDRRVEVINNKLMLTIW